MTYMDRVRDEIAAYDPLDVMLADVAVRIQLSPTDYHKAVQHYDTIAQWIDREDSPLHGLVDLVYPQGGFAVGATVARHSTDDEFDIDGMAQLNLSVDIDPESPLALLHEAIRGQTGSTYHQMTERKTRCITVDYDGMHLDLTPTIRLWTREERTGFIFHSKPDEPHQRTRLYANPFGFCEWFKAETPADEAFGYFFEDRSLEYARARAQVLMEKADADPVPDQQPAYRKSRAVIALQLIKRWRNLAYDRRHADRRRPPTILIAKYVATHANQTRGLAEELIHQVEQMIVIFEVAERLGNRVFERNPRCYEDILTDRWPGNGADQRIFLGELRALAAKLYRLRDGAALPEMQKILAELFGERPARAAIEYYINQARQDRATGNAVHMPGIGRIPALGAAAATATPSIVRATPRNTFFGD
jgi:Second Messenger Oligonucleotide or Dinucleotide Synthetase domain